MVEKNPRKDGEYLNSLARGLAVMKAFSKDQPEMTLSEIAVKTQLNPAVVRRCLNTLEHLGYVAKRGKHFLLRPAVFSLGSAFIESMNLDEVVSPSLQRVRDATDLSTAFAVISGLDILFLSFASTRMLTRMAAGIGTRFPAYATAAGRVLLAYRSEPELNEYFSRVIFEAFTDRTVTTESRLREILAETRQLGYSAITGELDFGLVSVAVPVFDLDGKILAAISCSAPINRTSESEMVSSHLGLLKDAAQEIELELKRCPMLIHSITA